MKRLALLALALLALAAPPPGRVAHHRTRRRRLDVPSHGQPARPAHRGRRLRHDRQLHHPRWRRYLAHLQSRRPRRSSSSSTPSIARVIYAKAQRPLPQRRWRRYLDALLPARRAVDHDGRRPRRRPTAHRGRPSGNVTAMAIDPGGLPLPLPRPRMLRCGPPTTPAPTGRSPAIFPAAANGIWIDPHSFKGDRTAVRRRPHALYIRQDGRWRTAPVSRPGQPRSPALRPPSTPPSRGKIYVTTDGGVKWRESSLPGFQGQAATLGVSAQHPEVAYVAYSGLRAPLHATSGRRQDHRRRRPLGARLSERARRVAGRSLRRGMGRHPVRHRRRAHGNPDDRLRDRFRPRRAHHRWRQDVDSRVFQARAGWQLDHQRDRRHHLLRRPLRPVRSAPHVHQLYRHRPVGQR